MPSTIYPIALSIATLLATHGLRKGSLSTSGAVAAFLVGYGHLANPVKVFGVTLIAFYLLGSRATKVDVEEKAKLEDGIDPHKPSGNRNWVQVFSNCLPSLIAALAYRFQVGQSINKSTTCVLDQPLPRKYIYLALAQLSTNFADTLASELGILSRTPPFSILTLKTVPPGTNGGVSLLGLYMSAVGGTVMGLVMVLDLWIENSVCLAGGVTWAVELIGFGCITGLLGSLLDSVLGATVQQTLYSQKVKKILTDQSKSQSATDQEIQRIGSGRDLLSNSGVNFVSGAIMAGLGYLWGGR